MTDWKPGDVAVRTWRGGDPRRAEVVDGCSTEYHDQGPHWHMDGGAWDPIDAGTHPASGERFERVEPTLVTIDPEDREQVERLRLNTLDALRRHDEAHGGLDDPRLTNLLQAALREFAAPTPRVCDAILTLGNLRIECERDPGHITDHRNDSIGQGVRWGA